MKKILIVSSGFILLAACFAFYQYNKPHKNLHQVNTDCLVSSTEIFKSFYEDEAGANDKFLDKVIEIRGKVVDIQYHQNGVTILLNGSEDGFGYVNCAINEQENDKIQSIKTGEYVLLKGVCTGYLMDVVINKCVIKNV